MSWIKRNLVFVIFAALAVALLGLAGWYLYAQWSLYNDNGDKLEAAYKELDRISKLNPNPGNASKPESDNIRNAASEEARVRAVIKDAQKYFAPIESIPPGPNVSSEAFAAALRRTVDDLTHDAANASVTIQPKYDFSFAAQKPLVKFAGSLDALAAQLGEVKAICDVLFGAKINTLYNLRRVRVSDDDFKGPQSDYIETSAQTNELAVLVPYEVTFYGFSTEIASVLAGFANQPHGFIVTTINVEPGMPSTASGENPGGVPSPYGGYGYANPNNPYGNPNNPYGMGNPYGAAQPGMAQATGATGTKGGLPVMLDERQLKVTMGIEIVKLQPKK